MSCVLLYQNKTPKLSVVLTTPGTYKSVALTIAHLRAQTQCQHLELVLVVSALDYFGLSAKALEGFAAVRVVEMGEVTSAGSGNAHGVLAATASLVVLSEDHAFPAPDWAELFIETHQEGWSVVGPQMVNLNSDSAVSRADFLTGYGLWSRDGQQQGREVTALPGHNSCYKRAVLLELGDELDAMMQAETVLHWRLHSQGYRLWFEPRIKVSHLNFALWRSWIPVQYHHGRLFAGSRAAEWGKGRRLFYALASPLIPLVRLGRVLRTNRSALRPSTLGAICIGLLVDGVGQMIGYLLGAGDAAQKLSHIEFERVNHITARDRQQVQAMEAAFFDSTSLGNTTEEGAAVYAVSPLAR